MDATSFVVVGPRAASAWSLRCRASAAEDSSLGLPRHKRLRKSVDVQRVQRSGTRIRLQRVLILYTPSESEQTRVGFTVSRKVGNAVVRNRVKRWLREAVRHQMADIPSGVDVVVIAHPQAAEANLRLLSQELSQGWSRMARQ